MLVSNIYNMVSEFIIYIYSDGYFSVKSLTFTMFVLFFYYELCKDVLNNVKFFQDINHEISYYNEEEIPKGKFKQLKETEKSIEIEENKTEPKEQLQLYKIFKNQK